MLQLRPPRASLRVPGLRRAGGRSGSAVVHAETKLFVARSFAVDVGVDGPKGRTLRDYVRLPAERYNVLDSRAVTRVPGEEGTFRVSTGLQRMVMFEAEPVGYVQIEVLPNGVEQRLTRAELVPAAGKASKVVDEINATLGNVRLTNTVTARAGPGDTVQLCCQLILSGAFTRGVLASVPEERLNGLMSWALGVAMPWFLTKLRTDYRQWERGEERRASLGAGEMAALAKSLMSSRGPLPEGVTELEVEGKALRVAPQTPTAEESGAQGAEAVKRESTAGKGFGRPK